MGSSNAFALALAIAAASTTMLGWAIAAAHRRASDRAFGVALLASGLGMLAISVFELIPSAIASGLGAARLGLALALGAAFVGALRMAASRIAPDQSRLKHSGAIVAVAIGLHNIPEGAAPYAAALVSVGAGVTTALALAAHNIPEGIAIAAPALASGSGRRRAFWLVAAATLAEMAGALLAMSLSFALSSESAGMLLAFVAGLMVTLSATELLPASISLLRVDDRHISAR